jgi:conjugative relaxase-like TrwC/TraI family protein
MAFVRMMGAESVAYHEATVLGRGDDHPGAALDYYGSRGETPLRWGGRGTRLLGLSGPVESKDYKAIYGPGGAADPDTRIRLANTKRPGMELVVSAHKSVAELGVIGRADDMHAILDAERDATLDYLDRLMCERGGRRGRAATPTPTGGLVYAHTRHATTRAGDPGPHDHVLIANVSAMFDKPGGWKAANTAFIREHVHAATAAGRMAAARKAIELGYGIVSDDGPSGRLRHWAIAGVPEQVMDLHSKRSDEIDDALDEAGFDSYRARGIAARTSRSAKRFEAVSDLVPRWRQELVDIGWRPHKVAARIQVSSSRRIAPDALTPADVRALVDHLLGPDGPLAARKVFCRRHVMVEAAPMLFGLDAAELDRVVDAVIDHGSAIPLVRRAGADEQPFAPACVLAIETAIAHSIERAAGRAGAPISPPQFVAAALDQKETQLGRPLTPGQRAAVEAICASGAGIDVIVGVAGSGKTTALDAARAAFHAAGYVVVGTATSGQAAQTLGAEAQMASSTVASLLWRLDHGGSKLNESTVVVLDEAGMTDDHDLLRLMAAADLARAKVVMVGDHRQLGAVGPGGGLEGIVDRHLVHVLDENVRQHDRREVEALAELRDGDVRKAIDWYLARGRVGIEPRRSAALAACARGWATEIAAGWDTTMLAWRRTSVDALNALGRAHWERAGRLTGPELRAPGGRSYRTGDRVVTLAPSDDRSVVTSSRATVVDVDPDRRALTIQLTDGRRHRLAADELAHDRLAHGYAVTVHRAQGATHDTAHVLEDGGGRELAYVKMSRARGRTTVYAVADDPDQAASDLRREWGSERRQRWAIDTGTPVTDLLEVEDSCAIAPAESMALRLARLDHEREVLRSSIPIDVSAGVPPDIQRIQWLELNPTVKARLDLMEFDRRELARALEGPAVAHGLGR